MCQLFQIPATIVGEKPPDEGGGDTVDGQHQPTSQPAQPTLDPVWTGHGVTGGTTALQRPFAQIIADETSTRNIIQLHLRRINPTEPNVPQPKNLTFEDLGEFLFDILKINPEDCLGLDFSTGRYDTREVKFKPDINVTPYLTSSTPCYFKNHEITVQRVLKNVTRVTFKNIPMSVPDEEIIHLCMAYSTPVDKIVHRWSGYLLL